ncbi:MAG: hypothetical protein IJF39_05085 [Clostridia bacterium]|nr:hypothetical protein [Clostridia bacterium]
MKKRNTPLRCVSFFTNDEHLSSRRDNDGFLAGYELRYRFLLFVRRSWRKRYSSQALAEARGVSWETCSDAALVSAVAEFVAFDGFSA